LPHNRSILWRSTGVTREQTPPLILHGDTGYRCTQRRGRFRPFDAHVGVNGRCTNRSFWHRSFSPDSKIRRLRAPVWLVTGTPLTSGVPLIVAPTRYESRGEVYLELKTSSIPGPRANFSRLATKVTSGRLGRIGFSCSCTRGLRRCSSKDTLGISNRAKPASRCDGRPTLARCQRIPS